jgi:dynein heavy chain 1
MKKVSEESWKLNEKISLHLQSWSENKPIDKYYDYSKALDLLCENQVLFDKMVEDYHIFSRARNVLGVSLIEEEHSELRIALEELHSLKQAWSFIGDVWKQINEVKGLPWGSLSFNRLKSSLVGPSEMHQAVPTFVKQYDGYLAISEKLEELFKINQLLLDFKSDVLRERHWNQIYSTLSINNIRKKSGLTLGDFWDSPIMIKEAEIKQIVLSAAGEAALEDFIQSVRNTWASTELSFVPYQSKCWLVKGFDEILSLCQEHLASLNSMNNSAYFSVFEDEAVSLERKLSTIYMIFDTWVDIQRQWIYLEGVFSGENEIGSILPIEATRFRTINNEFMQLMGKVYRIKKILDIIAISEIVDTFKRFENLFHSLQKSLGEFLSLQRTNYPRFFFIGDEDLLEIIGNSRDIFQIQKHVKKMIPGVSSVHLDSENGDIIAVESPEGEVIQLITPVERKSHQLIVLLDNLEASICETLLRSLEVTILDSSFFMDGFDILNWLKTTPCQILLLRLQIWWTTETETALQLSEKNRDHLSNLRSKIIRYLDILASILVEEMDPLNRKKVESMIMELVHQRDSLKKLIDDSISDCEDFCWKTFLRFYYNNLENDPKKRVSVQITNSTFYYGFEYVGVIERLVQTPLTDRCYSTLSQALYYKLGGSPFGPAGTGKTETVKALGAHLGRLVLVFNCDEHFNMASMSRILVGICKVGAWGCFDEFNRLEERILSSVSQQIHAIQNALRSRNEIELSGHQISVSSTTGMMFIIINKKVFLSP